MNENETKVDHDLVEIAGEIVCSFVTNNALATADLPKLIIEVHAALQALRNPVVAVEPLVGPKPAVSIRKSITPDFLICLEDGKKFKSLKRHLRSTFNMSPEEYRTKWDLPDDYPMVAPNYSASRSAMAKSIGLGRKAKAPEPVKRRGRKPAVV